MSVGERYEGYRRAMEQANLPIRPDYVGMGSFAPDTARAAVLRLLALPSPPTAIFASSDYIGIGALQALRELGWRVPEDISLVGFDDMPLSSLLTPPLTAVRQPVELLGRQGFQTLLALLNGEPTAPLARLPVELIVRHSVGAPRKKELRA